MDSDGSEINYGEVQEVPNKKRRSLFLPPDVTISEPTKTSDEDYLKKLKLEEETWNQLYLEQKEKKKKLLKELEIKRPQLIDYSLFNEEEIKYLNAGPDIAKFVREAEDLQNVVKIVRAQCEAKRQKYNLILDRIENTCLSITSKLNN